MIQELYAQYHHSDYDNTNIAKVCVLVAKIMIHCVQQRLKRTSYWV